MRADRPALGSEESMMLFCYTEPSYEAVLSIIFPGVVQVSRIIADGLSLACNWTPKLLFSLCCTKSLCY